MVKEFIRRDFGISLKSKSCPWHRKLWGTTPNLLKSCRTDKKERELKLKTKIQPLSSFCRVTNKKTYTYGVDDVVLVQ